MRLLPKDLPLVLVRRRRGPSFLMNSSATIRWKPQYVYRHPVFIGDTVLYAYYARDARLMEKKVSWGLP